MARALLAAGLFALRVIAFVPGGVVHAPHVAMPAVSKRPAGGSANAKAPALSMTQTLDSSEAAKDEASGPDTPSVISLMATSVINEWERDAAAAQASAGGDNKTALLMQSTQGVLSIMRADIIRRRPEYVFAIMTGTGYEDIQAIATVTPRTSFRRRRSIVEIHALAAKPTADGRETIGELIHKIRKWAGDRMVIVDLNRDKREYYQGLGFEPADMILTDTYSGFKLDEPSGKDSYRTITLKLDSDASPVRLPIKATTVMNEWLRDASERFSASIAKNDTQKVQLMHTTQNALYSMHRTIGEGIPYVFAYTTGVGVGDVRAMATLTKQVAWDDSLGREKEVIEIRELAATPSLAARDLLDGHRPVAELIYKIHSWAAGRYVTVHQDPQLAEYYRALGFEPGEMALPETLPSDDHEDIRMVSLELPAEATPLKSRITRWFRRFV